MICFFILVAIIEEEGVLLDLAYCSSLFGAGGIAVGGGSNSFFCHLFLSVEELVFTLRTATSLSILPKVRCRMRRMAMVALDPAYPRGMARHNRGEREMAWWCLALHLALTTTYNLVARWLLR